MTQLTRKFWGWGYEEVKLPEAHLQKFTQLLQLTLGIKQFETIAPPSLESLNLRVPRFALPAELQPICSSSPYDRASHSFGKSYRDIWRGLYGQFDNPPDYVAFPSTEDQIQQILAFAQAEKIAVIPFGGGSSVVGGVEPTQHRRYKGVISLDMKNFNQMLAIDKLSRTAHIQAGMYGPAIETALKKEGLTLRHYPQSFEFSTLGGWIVTRSGGHFATLFTHIEEFVEAIRVVTPQGIMETRRLPGSGAGPSEERLLAGSEGIFGVVTAAWVRVQDLPQYKATTTVKFKKFSEAVEAALQIAQSGLHPSNARLVDPLEAFGNGLGDGTHTVIILGFESAHFPVEDNLQKALSICKVLGGVFEANQPTPEKTQPDESADAWKKSFLLAPYLRDEMMQRGIIVETFETAITWDKFEVFHQGVNQAVKKAIQQHCGAGSITCRFTHLYPDGPAPYYTVFAKGEKGKELAQWDAIKAAASQAIVALGGTITHHHAVGKDHQPYYAQQQSALFGQILTSVKQSLDPAWILNPDVLINIPPQVQ
ncbi:MAG TPA: FAD-binding oxidoreductase [Microscillaceae bacterium]|nr:FAD-binding oxidoreductase [Microscillaceae bacterium]